MFRLITLWCLIHLSVGNVIRGRVLLDGDVHQNDPIPANSRLVIRLEQIVDEETTGALSEEIEISTLSTFPVEYQIEIPSSVSPKSSFRLSAQVKRGPIFLYVGEETVPAATDSDHPITVDIPVRIVRGRRAVGLSFTNMGSLSWPELVGREGTYAVHYIKEKTGLTNVSLIPQDAAVTMDYRMDRVRVFVDKHGIVVRTPRIG